LKLAHREAVAIDARESAALINPTIVGMKYANVRRRSTSCDTNNVMAARS
jgi:hypothetical protein